MPPKRIMSAKSKNLNMKNKRKIGILIATLLVLANELLAQMEPQQYNLFDFSSHMTVTSELDSLTGQFWQEHPEYGVLPRYTPCEDCVELVERRTENTRYFIANGSKGTHFWQQTANGPLHYLSPAGYWLSFDGRLSPSGEGVYTSPHQVTPTMLDVNNKKTSFTLPDGDQIVLNNNVHLLYGDSVGTISDLGVASWDNISAGEDGAYVTNAWSDIDIELLYEKDGIKTTYIIKSSLGYSSGHLIFRDFLEMPDDYVHTFSEGVQGEKGWIGKTVFYPTDMYHEYEFTWDKAVVTDGYTMLEKEDFLTHGTYGQYLFDSVSKILDLYVSNDWLNDSERIYPIRVDPLVTSTTTSTVVYKFRINGEFCGGATYCSNVIDAVLPPNCTVTNATSNVIYTTASGTCAFQCWRSDAAFRIWSDSCDNFYPSAIPTPLYLSCIPPTGNSIGNCVGFLNISSLFSCLTPKCSGSIPIEFRTSYCYCNANGTCPAGAAVPCTTIALGNASVTIEGHTVEASGATYTIGCWDDQILDPFTVYGVPNYTYDWSTGETTPTITFNSGGVAGTFTRTCTITDECGVEVTVTFTINTICGLPIEILEYKAVVKGNEVEIWWTTASENNNSFFTLEKSADSKNFTLLNTVEGAGNSTSPIRYETMDQNPYFGTNYYRLSQTDFDGNKSPIGVVAVELGGINIYPNPANDILHIEISSNNNCWIEIRDIYGNIVLRELSNGNNLLNISSFKSGVYLVTVHSDFGIIYETKVIKK
jgi:hypothetical protein